MKVTLEPSSQVVDLSCSDPLRGLRARIWQGETDAGIPIVVYVALVAVDEKHQAEFDEALESTRPPIVQWPQRFLV